MSLFQISYVFLERDSELTHSFQFCTGQYEDRRNGATIDCSKTIWILATNALDKTITNFCDVPENALILSHDESTEKTKLGKKLSKALKQAFLAQFTVRLLPRVIYSTAILLTTSVGPCHWPHH